MHKRSEQARNYSNIYVPPDLICLCQTKDDTQGKKQAAGLDGRQQKYILSPLIEL